MLKNAPAFVPQGGASRRQADASRVYEIPFTGAPASFSPAVQAGNPL